MNTSPAVSGDRLITFNEALSFIGFRSRTSLYKLIGRELPEPITRGRNRYFFESDIARYLARLAAQRQEAC